MSGDGRPVRAQVFLTVPAFNDLEGLGTLSEFSPTVKQTILEGMLKESGIRSIEEVECEHHTMLLEWLARRRWTRASQRGRPW
jgi:hypothetical protein